MKKSARKRATRRAASRAPGYVRDIAASTWKANDQRHHESRKLGKFGAASTVRRIDPITGEVIPLAD